MYKYLFVFISINVFACCVFPTKDDDGGGNENESVVDSTITIDTTITVDTTDTEGNGLICLTRIGEEPVHCCGFKSRNFGDVSHLPCDELPDYCEVPMDKSIPYVCDEQPNDELG